MPGVRSQPIKIAVSSCLLGNAVRYDGTHKQHDLIKQHLCKHFHCIPVCPETAIGMGVPRRPIQLRNLNGTYNAVGVHDPSLNVTAALEQFAEQFASQHTDIGGFVFKARSPSCGFRSTPLFDIHGIQTDLTSGLFAKRVYDLLPGLPIAEETQFTDEAAVLDFQMTVMHYREKHSG